jgi:signal transduction histidine kinase
VHFSAVEDLSTDLEGKNRSLQEQIKERARLETEIVNLSENERRHLSHELHDGLCQQLTAARLYCDVLKEDMTGHPGELQVTQLSTMLVDSVDHAYNLSRGLWPVDLDQLGSSTFLEEFCHRVAAPKGIAVKVQHRRACTSCSNESITQFYRIAQEAITNAVKHSGASLIKVGLDYATHPGRVIFSVRDNGIGRQAALPSSGGMGTRIMAHRAQMIGGELKISDVAGGGTEVRCKIKCTHGTNDQADD